MNTVLITGGSRGIGAETVRLFRARGWQAAFTYLQSEEKAVSLARETGARAYRCDVRKEEDVKALYEHVCRDFPHLDGLICNAGIAKSGLLQDLAVSDWDDLFSVHVRGAFLVTRAFLPDMISRKCGSILYISSMWGQVGASCEAAYSACKAALIGLSKALAKEVGPSGIRVNCLCPGAILTDMLRGFSEDDLNALKEDTPLMRIGAPEDIARAAYFLLNPDASFITGQVIGVNGGYVI